jgi:parallel beta-helix repeat protein
LDRAGYNGGMAVCVVALVILLVLGAGPVAASHVSCGDTITADTTLDSDLDCEGDGLRIGADDVTLDLGGHRIDAGGTGVANRAGHDGVVVRDGVISAADVGVSLVGASGNRLRGLTVDEGDVGVSLDDSDDNSVVHNSVLSYEFFGVVLDHSDRNRLGRNSVSSPFGPFTGIALGRSNGNRVVRNSVSSNGVGISLIRSSRNRLARNSTSENVEDGIFISLRSPGTLVERNVANRNGDDGIDVEARATTLTRNTANHNGDLGIEAVAGVTDGGGNKAASNGNPAQCTGVACS